MIILKARQEGVSTLCEALIFERNWHDLEHPTLNRDHGTGINRCHLAMSKSSPISCQSGQSQAEIRQHEANGLEIRTKTQRKRARTTDPDMVLHRRKVKVGRGLTIHNSKARKEHSEKCN